MGGVSVLIPAFNAARSVGEAISSALEQDRVEQILVVDDGSTDATPQVLDSFGSRIRWVRQSRQGPNPTRNRLLHWSSAAWLQFLDADDALMPGKIRRQLERAEGCDVVASPSLQGGLTRHWGPGEDPWIRFFHAHLGITSTNLWRREAVMAIGGWNP
ncbi:MAG: glycosyltransferase family 2 protein, partial [Candidatus Binatia bacterium]